MALAVPAAAAAPEVRPVSPKKGGTKSTFTFTYDSLGAEAFSGDSIYVNGPRGTRCHGMVINDAVGDSGGLTTVHMGPRVKERDTGTTYWFRPRDPDREGRHTPFTTWCKGVYRGRVDHESSNLGNNETLVRFRFKVG